MKFTTIGIFNFHTVYSVPITLCKCIIKRRRKSKMEYSILSNDVKMPMEGFGVFRVTDRQICKRVRINRYPRRLPFD